MQAGLGWAKKKGSNQTQAPTLTEIQVNIAIIVYSYKLDRPYDFGHWHPKYGNRS